jgi:hypothetical protein
MPKVLVQKITGQPLVGNFSHWNWNYFIPYAADTQYQSYAFNSACNRLVLVCLNKLPTGRSILERFSPGRDGSFAKDLWSIIFKCFIHGNPSFEYWSIFEDSVI